VGVDSVHIPATDTPIANNSIIDISTDRESPKTLASLDEQIANFVRELEELKANDEILLHEKKDAIENLESQMKALKDEVKKIQADEQKIESTIASLHNAPTKTK